MSHGTATTPEANRKIGRWRALTPIREWVKRGFAVIVPVRRGYGASGGDAFGDSYGTCRSPDFRRAGEGAAVDLLATIDWAKTQRDLDPRRWLLVGQSAGGFASIYTVSKHPDGLVAVLPLPPPRPARRAAGGVPTPPRGCPACPSGWPSCSPRLRPTSRCRSCGSMRRTTPSSARPQRTSGSIASARPAGAATS